MSGPTYKVTRTTEQPAPDQPQFAIGDSGALWWRPWPNGNWTCLIGRGAVRAGAVAVDNMVTRREHLRPGDTLAITI